MSEELSLPAAAKAAGLNSHKPVALPEQPAAAAAPAVRTGDSSREDRDRGRGRDRDSREWGNRGRMSRAERAAAGAISQGAQRTH